MNWAGELSEKYYSVRGMELLQRGPPENNCCRRVVVSKMIKILRLNYLKLCNYSLQASINREALN